MQPVVPARVPVRRLLQVAPGDAWSLSPGWTRRKLAAPRDGCTEVKSLCYENLVHPVRSRLAANQASVGRPVNARLSFWKQEARERGHRRLLLLQHGRPHSGSPPVPRVWAGGRLLRRRETLQLPIRVSLVFVGPRCSGARASPPAFRLKVEHSKSSLFSLDKLWLRRAVRLVSFQPPS